MPGVPGWGVAAAAAAAVAVAAVPEGGDAEEDVVPGAVHVVVVVGGLVLELYINKCRKIMVFLVQSLRYNFKERFDHYVKRSISITDFGQLQTQTCSRSCTKTQLPGKWNCRPCVESKKYRNIWSQKYWKRKLRGLPLFATWPPPIDVLSVWRRRPFAWALNFRQKSRLPIHFVLHWTVYVGFISFRFQCLYCFISLRN